VVADSACANLAPTPASCRQFWALANDGAAVAVVVAAGALDAVAPLDVVVAPDVAELLEPPQPEIIATTATDTADMALNLIEAPFLGRVRERSSLGDHSPDP
jgi:hypothetical protein